MRFRHIVATAACVGGVLWQSRLTQVMIDRAAGHALAGWAADLDSTIDTGVDTIHVWAYPIDAGRRGVDGLASGTYDLAVFACSTVGGGFAPAKVVRVTIR